MLKVFAILNTKVVNDGLWKSFFYFFIFLNLFYYMCIPHNITTFVFKKNNRIQYITRKEKIRKYYSTVCTYELETVGVLIQWKYF